MVFLEICSLEVGVFEGGCSSVSQGVFLDVGVGVRGVEIIRDYACFIDGRRNVRICGHVRCYNTWMFVDGLRKAFKSSRQIKRMKSNRISHGLTVQ